MLVGRLLFLFASAFQCGQSFSMVIFVWLALACLIKTLRRSMFSLWCWIAKPMRMRSSSVNSGFVLHGLDVLQGEAVDRADLVFDVLGVAGLAGELTEPFD